MAPSSGELSMDSKSSPAVFIPANTWRIGTAGSTRMDLASAVTVTLQDSKCALFAFRCLGTTGPGVQCTWDWLIVDHKEVFLLSLDS